MTLSDKSRIMFSLMYECKNQTERLAAMKALNKTGFKFDRQAMMKIVDWNVTRDNPSKSEQEIIDHMKDTYHTTNEVINSLPKYERDDAHEKDLNAQIKKVDSIGDRVSFAQHDKNARSEGWKVVSK